MSLLENRNHSCKKVFLNNVSSRSENNLGIVFYTICLLLCKSCFLLLLSEVIGSSVSSVSLFLPPIHLFLKNIYWSKVALQCCVSL